MRNLRMVVSVLIQVLLVVCMFASSGESAVWVLKDNAVNSVTSATVDDTTPYTGLYSLKVDGTERMFQQCFWYRLGSTGPEASLETLAIKSVSKPTATSLSLTYTLADQFDITILYELTPYAMGVGKATVKKTVTITNISSAELDYHLFEYSDFDITNLATNNDNLEIVKNRFYQNGPQSDGNGVTLVHESSLVPDQYDIDTSQAYMLSSLKDNNSTNLGLSVLTTPYRYGDDMQFGNQWDLKIPVGQSISFTITDNIYPTWPVPVTQTMNGGQCVSYGAQANISISLTGTADNLTNVNIVDALPTNTVFLSATDGGVLDSASNSVSWNLPTLAVNAGTQIRQASITVNSANDLVNNVLVVSDQAFPTRLPNPLLADVPVFQLCNHPPSITSIPITTVNIESPYVYAVQGADVDAGTTLSYALDVAPTGMTINPATGVILWNPTSADAGSHTVTVSVSDGSLSKTQSFVLTVISVPLFTSTPVTSATAYQPYTYTVVAVNPISNGAVNYSKISGPSGLSVGTSSGIITWTPTTAGSETISIQASDASGANIQTFTINVTLLPNDPPVITS
ncbi:MAG: Ig domain-containing protein, partial [Pedobacter sp.]